METMNITLSREVFERMDGLEERACYFNALLTFLTQEEFKDGAYVEGFCVFDFDGIKIPFDHAWVEYNGDIIDPTYIMVESTDGIYFPGAKYLYTEALKLKNVTPPAVWTKGKAKLKEYLRASLRANIYAYGEEMPEIVRMAERLRTGLVDGKDI